MKLEIFLIWKSLTSSVPSLSPLYSIMIKIRLSKPQTPKEFQEIELKLETIPSKECLIGRAVGSQLQLDSSEVSRMHGKIFVIQGSYYYNDLGSKAGSSLNDENVQLRKDYPLKHGDKIRICGFVLEVVEIASEQAQKMTVDNGITTETVFYSEPMPVALVEPANFTRWTKGDLTVRCIQIIDETHDVKTFRFVADSSLLFTYKPGQFVTLNLEINGEEISRSYSISSTPSRPHCLEITVKRVPAPDPALPPGLVSNWLHDNIKVGSQINLTGPMGKFTCFEKPTKKLLLISAGSGITPMMAMSRWIYDTCADVDTVFFHSARSPQDIIFHQELKLLSAQYPNFRLAVSTTRREPGQSWMGFTGRLDAVMMKLIAPDYCDRTVYVCGPNPFMEATKQMLESIGFPMDNYHEESFGSPPKAQKSKEPLPKPLADSSPRGMGLQGMLNSLQDPGVSKAIPSGSDKPSATVSKASVTQAVVFSKSSKEVVCDGEESILDLADQEGVKIRSSCRAGSCGACKKRKLEGEITYQGEPEALEEEDKQEGYILTCIAYPAGRVVIDA